MSYVKRSPTSSKDGRISVTEESEGVAPCSYEHCQNYYQFISLSVKSYPSFVRIRCEFLKLLAAARVRIVSATLAVQGSSPVNTIIELLKSKQQISFTTRT